MVSAARLSAVVELEGEPAAAPGQDRRRAIVIALCLCLAVGGALVGRDGPAATAPPIPALSLPAGESDVVLFTFPDRLANEAAPVFLDKGIRIRSTEGLAYSPAHGGDLAMVTWTEHGTVYWLFSKRRDVEDLVRLADTLR